jgi:hypothetical protein
VQRISPISLCRYPAAETANGRLAAAFGRLTDADFRHRSHFIGGRFENLYLDPDRLPGVGALLAFAEDQARQVLGIGAAPLRCGFWLNAMEPGQRTSTHGHDENDEFLSGVYYITVPPDSGDILFHDDPFEVRLTPEPGMLLFFPPALVHSVEENRSGERRLSLAFNIGPGQ